MGAFHQYEHFGASAEQVTNFLAEQDWSDEMDGTTSLFIWFLSVAVREIELDVLEDRVLCEISYYIPLYEHGEYNDLSAEEKELVDKDVEYIKSKVALIPFDQLRTA